ncbi:hypothetical protein V490_07459 [Pseudogymnoascus sp. VKM F-3557]|nr:hypothetical protein V490_07459 [Pseudogymnoascus sp. VKM F-3557]
MGVGEDAHAWREAQGNDQDKYIVIGPVTFDKRKILKPNPVKVFMEPRKEGTLPGEGGTLYLGDNAMYADNKYQEHDVDEALGCSAEGGVRLAYVAKGA